MCELGLGGLPPRKIPNLTLPEIVSACNHACLGMELTTKPSQCVSLSQRPQVLLGEVRLSHDSAATTSTAAGVSGLTLPFYYT